VPVVLITLYFAVVLKWNYSTGERAGWVQKFSKKGWICKTWEGELSMVSMPGASPEKFYFTVWDDKVAADINAAMGRRVSLHYDEKVGLPTTCFGETRHWVNGITVVQEIPLAPGITIPAPGFPPPATLRRIRRRPLTREKRRLLLHSLPRTHFPRRPFPPRRFPLRRIPLRNRRSPSHVPAPSPTTR
jgi:hypothetical protein